MESFAEISVISCFNSRMGYSVTLLIPAIINRFLGGLKRPFLCLNVIVGISMSFMLGILLIYECTSSLLLGS